VGDTLAPVGVTTNESSTKDLRCNAALRMSGFGSGDTPIPPRVVEVASGRPVRIVWANEVGGITCEVGRGVERVYVKWYPSSELDLLVEAQKLSWAAQFFSVPIVIDTGRDNDGSWMTTLPIPGENAVTTRWKANPKTATRAIGEALRALHEALPVAECPWDWSAETRVSRVLRRGLDRRPAVSDLHEDHRRLGIERALELVAEIPPLDRLVVCHGDTCAPNTIIQEDGTWSGIVDLGALGVGDRWADLAVATWSTQWNYGPGWEGELLDAYGIDVDEERTRYYRLLWDLDPDEA
jgi:aminoglycoside phosphotransferase